MSLSLCAVLQVTEPGCGSCLGWNARMHSSSSHSFSSSAPLQEDGKSQHHQGHHPQADKGLCEPCAPCCWVGTGDSVLQGKISCCCLFLGRRSLLVKPCEELKRTNTQDLSLSLMQSWAEVWPGRSTVPLPGLVCHQQLCSF